MTDKVADPVAGSLLKGWRAGSLGGKDVAEEDPGSPMSIDQTEVSNTEQSQRSPLKARSSDFSAVTAPARLYLPLNEEKDEIRLVTILPVTNDSCPVSCKLETVSLLSRTAEYQNLILEKTDGTEREKLSTQRWPVGNPPVRPDGNRINESNLPGPPFRFTWGDFAALSYVWGDPKLTSNIIINGIETLVSRNLEVALRALSARTEFQGHYRIWIDAICINQDDLIERGKQISRMRIIYGGARAVIAWLGEEADGSTVAMALIQTLSEAYKKEWGATLVEDLCRDPDLLGFGSWMALHDLVNRSYWYRLWIIQELVLGSYALELCCGDISLPWTAFCEGIGFLVDNLWTIKDDLLAREIDLLGLKNTRQSTWITASLHLIHQDLWALSMRKDTSKDFLNFGRLLDVARFAHVTDPRDKVYGLVGLMDPIVAAQLASDYQAPRSAAYAATARALITAYGNLDPIREGNPWGSSGTPSWAADWTWHGRPRHTRPENALWGPFWKLKGPPPIHRDAIPYNASGTETPIFSFSRDNRFLTCRGFIVDTIDGLAARGKGYFEWDSSSIIQPTSPFSSYQTVSAVETALFTTLVGDRVADGDPASERHRAIFSLPSTFEKANPQFEKRGWSWLASQEGYYFRWEKWREANRDFLIMGKRLDDYFGDVIPDDAKEIEYAEVYSCIDRTGKARRLMSTQNGFLGWAPDNMNGGAESQTRKGDLVVILLGCSTPLVVYRFGNGFKVVGEAFVQGMMNGEALEWLKMGWFELRDFTFC